MGELALESVNDKGNALVHQVVQIGRDTRHLYHHAKSVIRKKKTLSHFSTYHNTNHFFSLTDNR